MASAPTSAVQRPIPGMTSDRCPVLSGKAQQAMEYCKKIYADKKHWTGVSLIEHVQGVLGILTAFRPDDETMAACFLQHALQVRGVGVPELEEEFGAEIRGLVSSIHLLSHVTMRSTRRSIEDLRLMLLSVSDDVRVLLIILCERAYVLEHLAEVPPAERKRLCRDVLNLFAPVAARLGIHSLKQRLESLAFPLVYALDGEKIAEQLAQVHGRYGSFLPACASALEASLRQQGISAQVSGREKQPYSIFQKMTSKSFSGIESLPDLFALRVIVRTVEDCYRVLGILHQAGRPSANRFKDYIAFPKPNGYQSLHTTVARLPGAPEHVSVEVQIRTESMHREAELGVAAHWSYKEGGSAAQSIRRVQLQQVLTSQQPIEGVRGRSHFVDHIFVLTPKGDIVELPEGATPLDFAFQIHSDVGLAFKTARVNGHVVPLDYELENGDVVEIVTRSSPAPSPEWLHTVKMASSRTRLRHYLHSLNRSTFVTRGREMLNEELVRRRLPSLDTELSALRSYAGAILSFEEREDLLMKLGQGGDKVSAVIAHADALRSSGASTPVLRKAPRFQRKDALIEVEGGVPMPLRFAKCCKPNEGDRGKIAGVITRSGEVTVHDQKCKLMQRGNPERRIGVKWKRES